MTTDCGIGPWSPGLMDKDDNKQVTETSDEGYPIEIYTDQRIREFLNEDKLTPEEKKRLEERLTKSKSLKSSTKFDRP